MFATASIELSNPFSALDSSENHDLDLLTQPQTSTPTRQSTRSNLVPPKNRVSGLKTILMNCNSLKSVTKQAAFRAHVEQHDPDIILGCESKIDVQCHPTRCFPTTLHSVPQG